MRDADGDMEGLSDRVRLCVLYSFYANLDDADERHFCMEREWRVYGDVKFLISDIERLIVPREFGKRLRADLPEYNGQVHFLD